MGDVAAGGGQPELNRRRVSADTLVASNRLDESGVDHRVEPSTWFTNGSAERSAAESESSQPSPGSESLEADPAAPGVTNGHAPSYSGGGPQPGGNAHQGGGGADPWGNGYQGVDPEPRGTSYAGASPDPRAYPGVGPEPRGSAYPDGGGPGTGGSPFGVGGSAMSEQDQDGYGVSAYQRPVPPYPAQVPAGAGTSLSGVAAKVTAQLSALAKTKPKTRPPARPARPGQTGPMPRMTVSGRGPATNAPSRRAQLTLARIEPWSVMKFSFMVSLVGWVVLFVAVAALYWVLSKLGVFHSIQDTISSVTSSKNSAGADSGGQWFSASRILGYTMLIGAINVVLITALCTVGAVIYNLVTHLAGGIEVTLKESD